MERFISVTLTLILVAIILGKLIVDRYDKNYFSDDFNSIFFYLMIIFSIMFLTTRALHDYYIHKKLQADVLKYCGEECL